MGTTNLEELEYLHQNKLSFANKGNMIEINVCNFMLNLQWNNMEKEMDAILDYVLRLWDQKGLKERLLQCMEENLFFLESEHEFQGISHLFLAMEKIRC